MVTRSRRIVGARKYKDYSDDAKKRAVEAVSNGSSVREAAKLFGVSKSSINRAVNGNQQCNPGSQPILSANVESTISYYLTLTAKWGFPFSAVDVRRVARAHVEAHGTGTHIRDAIPGVTWFHGFLERNPDVKERKARNINRSRASITCETRRVLFQSRGVRQRCPTVASGELR
jgi:plasmid maintenance system antidote protein VapI